MKRYVITYGIACVDEEDGMRELIAEVPGITARLEEIERLVRMCNEGDLSPNQLGDVVEDLIGAV